MKMPEAPTRRKEKKVVLCIDDGSFFEGKTVAEVMDAIVREAYGEGRNFGELRFSCDHEYDGYTLNVYELVEESDGDFERRVKKYQRDLAIYVGQSIRDLEKTEREARAEKERLKAILKDQNIDPSRKWDEGRFS